VVLFHIGRLVVQAIKDPGLICTGSAINCNDLGKLAGQEITHDALRADSLEQPLPIFVIRHV
jgi:hypothetical protein